MKINYFQIVKGNYAKQLFTLLDKKTAMDDSLSQTAISSALTGDWEKALLVNQQILKNDPQDVDALNRLSRAYAELGNLKKAKQSAKKVLSIDPYNTIAAKSLKKWKSLKRAGTYKSQPSSAQVFLEEPGKTKIVSLMHLGGREVLCELDAGDEVSLNSNSHRLSITSFDGKYVGRLPDDLSARLRKLIKYGNAYQLFIKSIDPQMVKIFIRETKRAEKLKDIPSFSSDKITYVSFTPPELVHKKERVFVDEEGEE